MYGRDVHGSVLAVGTILVHLLSHLVAKGALSNTDVQGILADSTNELATPRPHVGTNKDALDVISEIMKRFP
jgi:hypothetical protein